jgi:hypothetical protein
VLGAVVRRRCGSSSRGERMKRVLFWWIVITIIVFAIAGAMNDAPVS